MSAEASLYFELHALEIRLLKIAPGGWHDEIECELIHTSLPNKPVFDALSYAWGSPKLVRSISLNRERREVTASAHQALRRLRQTYGTATVWIDALCINQSDDKERTHQVGLMRDIFTSARQVVVYLGEAQNSKSNVSSKPTFFQPKADHNILSSFAARYSRQDVPKIPKMDEALEVFCLIHSIARFDTTSRCAADSEYHRRLFEALRQLMRCR
ncbi:Heterokaryon incompatibility protein [Lasiodiplodia theobromae]|uniref:Heterokaryon incompatibility protein n=1 Tax=Lasiodiplodia theobromae TaxID=45133 RepID=UPI0015C375A9|nr:Heterokaryon incompatibility protein [Lasiodiplodia theobromae]KAF4544636.1 Heterokaryon incompatibility protein [Lasiodiplodia theobromae]